MKSIGLLLTLLTTTFGCASVTQLHTARTLKEKQRSFVFGFGMGNVVPASVKSNAEIGVDLQGMMRFGITDRDEVGIRVSNFVYFSGDYKRAVVQGENLHFSVGASVGAAETSDVREGGPILDVSLPLYADYWFDDFIALYTSPKFALHTVLGGPLGGSYPLVGLSGGVRWGLERGLLLEAGYSQRLSGDSAGYWQLIGGVFY